MNSFYYKRKNIQFFNTFFISLKPSERKVSSYQNFQSFECNGGKKGEGGWKESKIRLDGHSHF